MDRRAIACFDEALVDAGLPVDTRLQKVLHNYFEWATTNSMSGYHRSEDDVPDGLATPIGPGMGSTVKPVMGRSELETSPERAGDEGWSSDVVTHPYDCASESLLRPVGWQSRIVRP